MRLKLLLKCPLHGYFFPGREEIRRQKELDTQWECPQCGLVCELTEANLDWLREGCGQCKKALHIGPCLVYDDRLLMFFCGVECQSSFRQEMKDEYRRGIKDVHI
jgi:hypothetical protein